MNAKRSPIGVSDIDTDTTLTNGKRSIQIRIDGIQVLMDGMDV